MILSSTCISSSSHLGVDVSLRAGRVLEITAHAGASAPVLVPICSKVVLRRGVDLAVLSVPLEGS